MNNNILIINSGSSSLKFQLFNSKNEQDLIKGHFDGIGTLGKKNCEIKYEIKNINNKLEVQIKSHKDAIKELIKVMLDKKVITDLNEIKSVGHRIVHGGEKYYKPTKLTKKVLDELEKISDLAPLHNPINISCAKIIMKQIPNAKHFGLFDTAFHHTIPKKIFLYALPKELYKKYGIRKYGFHGASHKFVANESAKLMNKKISQLKIITCHLGNGQSISAIKNGKSYDTSMGFTPLEGLPMGTRSGSFDPEIILFLLNKGYKPKEIKTIINKKSGILGISNLSNDMRIIYDKSKKANKNAKLTINILSNRITKIIGSYIAEMNGVDVIVFTAGVGENAFYLRKKVLKNFEYLGLKIDKEKNKNNALIINNNSSKIKVFVIPTNEELQMMREIKKIK